MVKPVKIDTVESIKADYTAAARSGGALVFAEYKGLRVADMFKLRRSLKEKAVKLRVLKNTLVRRALMESGVAGADHLLKGPIAVAFSPDEVSAPKVMAAFAREIDALKQARKLVIKGGVLNGKAISEQEVAVLATLPSRDEVMARLLATINAPATQLLRLIQEPAARMARLVKAAAQKQEAPTS